MPHFNFKGERATTASKRARAREMYPAIGTCERCQKKPATDRHHKDGDTGHNARSNVAFLCRRCHMAEDGRLVQGLEKARASRKPKELRSCRICEQLTKRLSKGRCHRCEEYLRRNQIEWTPEGDHRFGKHVPDRYCDNCSRKVEIGWAKGRCPACRLYFKANERERPVG